MVEKHFRLSILTVGVFGLVVFPLFIPFGPAQGATVFPDDQLVEPPRLDPRAPNNHLKVFVFSDEGSDEQELLGAEVALTHNWGAWRSDSEASGRTYQINLEAGVFSQFQESIDDFELTNSDFYVGIPLEIRNTRHHFRFNIFHISSHLGDEFQNRTGRNRISFSQEVLRGTYFYQADSATRLYGGTEYALRMEPDVGETVLFGGVEHHFTDQWLTGADFRSMERNDWSVASTVRLGRYFGGDHLFTGLEFFDGPLPMGQFFDEKRTYIGLSFIFKG